MFGLGTIINVGGILLGGVLGMLFGNRLEKRYQDTLMVATAVCVLFLGISGALQEMMTVSDGKLSSGGTMMMIGSFAIGSLIRKSFITSSATIAPAIPVIMMMP